MEEVKYKDQRIRFDVIQPPGTAHWTGKADVYFNNGRTLRLLTVRGLRESFASRDEAEQCVIEAAKKLIDDLI